MDKNLDLGQKKDNFSLAKERILTKITLRKKMYSKEDYNMRVSSYLSRMESSLEINESLFSNFPKDFLDAFYKGNDKDKIEFLTKNLKSNPSNKEMICFFVHYLRKILIEMKGDPDKETDNLISDDVFSLLFSSVLMSNDINVNSNVNILYETIICLIQIVAHSSNFSNKILTNQMAIDIFINIYIKFNNFHLKSNILLMFANLIVEKEWPLIEYLSSKFDFIQDISNCIIHSNDLPINYKWVYIMNLRLVIKNIPQEKFQVLLQKTKDSLIIVCRELNDINKNIFEESLLLISHLTSKIEDKNEIFDNIIKDSGLIKTIPSFISNKKNDNTLDAIFTILQNLTYYKTAYIKELGEEACFDNVEIFLKNLDHVKVNNKMSLLSLLDFLSNVAISIGGRKYIFFITNIFQYILNLISNIHNKQIIQSAFNLFSNVLDSCGNKDDQDKIALEMIVRSLPEVFKSTLDKISSGNNDFNSSDNLNIYSSCVDCINYLCQYGENIDSKNLYSYHFDKIGFKDILDNALLASQDGNLNDKIKYLLTTYFNGHENIL